MRTSTWLQLLTVAAGSALLVARHRRYKDLRGATAVVTGGSRGLGLAIARELVRAGAHVTLLARTAGDLERARGELAAMGGDVVATVCDVGDAQAVACAMSDVLARRGRIDVLINNAGAIQVGPLEHMTTADFERAMRVHFWGPLHTMMAAAPIMRGQGGGRIVNVASIGGRVAVPHMAPYTSSKFALVGLSSALRAELARHRVYVTTVCPGLMRTGSHINAEMKGKHRAEYAWFAIADSTPLLSMDVRKAAERIVEAARRGEAHLDLGLPTRIAAIAEGIAPALVSDAMGLVSRLLPGPTDASGDRGRRGKDSTSALAPSALTRLGDEASAANNELRPPLPIRR
jgi:NAD(P)-dependent dehydrogenase (short-subunit alcohol dehydrogenase family)